MPPASRSLWVIVYRRKYQHEQSHWARVSVSRRAGPPHFGHGVLTHVSTRASGLSPFGGNSTSVSAGNSTGRSPAGTGTSPQEGQWTIGTGAPQYRCRLMSQSRMR